MVGKNEHFRSGESEPRMKMKKGPGQANDNCRYSKGQLLQKDEDGRVAI
jgi:hypothetical protein